MPGIAPVVLTLTLLGEMAKDLQQRSGDSQYNTTNTRQVRLVSPWLDPPDLHSVQVEGMMGEGESLRNMSLGQLKKNVDILAQIHDIIHQRISPADDIKLTRLKKLNASLKDKYMLNIDEKRKMKGELDKKENINIEKEERKEIGKEEKKKIEKEMKTKIKEEKVTISKKKKRDKVGQGYLNPPTTINHLQENENRIDVTSLASFFGQKIRDPVDKNTNFIFNPERTLEGSTLDNSNIENQSGEKNNTSSYNIEENNIGGFKNTIRDTEDKSIDNYETKVNSILLANMNIILGDNRTSPLEKDSISSRKNATDVKVIDRDLENILIASKSKNGDVEGNSIASAEKGVDSEDIIKYLEDNNRDLEDELVSQIKFIYPMEANFELDNQIDNGIVYNPHTGKALKPPVIPPRMPDVIVKHKGSPTPAPWSNPKSPEGSTKAISSIEFEADSVYADGNRSVDQRSLHFTQPKNSFETAEKPHLLNKNMDPWRSSKNSVARSAAATAPWLTATVATRGASRPAPRSLLGDGLTKLSLLANILQGVNLTNIGPDSSVAAERRISKYEIEEIQGKPYVRRRRRKFKTKPLVADYKIKHLLPAEHKAKSLMPGPRSDPFVQELPIFSNIIKVGTNQDEKKPAQVLIDWNYFEDYTDLL